MSTTLSTLGPIAQRAADVLVAAVDGPAAAVISTVDGFPLGQAGSRAIDPARLAAVISSMAALGDAAGHETGIGQPRCLAIDATEGRMVIRRFEVRGESVIVVLLTDLRVLMGMAFNLLGDTERLLTA